MTYTEHGGFWFDETAHVVRRAFVPKLVTALYSQSPLMAALTNQRPGGIMGQSGYGILPATAGTSFGTWSECAPGIYRTDQADPQSGCFVISNTCATAAAVHLYPNTIVNVPATSTVYVQPSLGGGPATVHTGAGLVIPSGVTYSGSGTSITTTAGGTWAAFPGPQMVPAGIVPSGLNDPLMPRDELVFATNPLTLTDENKRAIRAFVMEIPSLAKIVKAALAKLREIRAKMEEARRAKDEWANLNSIAKGYAAQAMNQIYQATGQASKKSAPYEADTMRRYCAEHEEQVKRLLKDQEAKYRKSLKWTSMFPASRTFAAD